VATTENHLCCGSAGTYSLFQPEISRRLLERKLAALSVGEPEQIVTANIGCQLHLASRSDVPVRHWIELLDESK
jgi:glycolate oxidase iron-sulfur subunit